MRRRAAAARRRAAAAIRQRLGGDSALLCRCVDARHHLCRATSDVSIQHTLAIDVTTTTLTWTRARPPFFLARAIVRVASRSRAPLARAPSRSRVISPASRSSCASRVAMVRHDRTKACAFKEQYPAAAVPLSPIMLLRGVFGNSAIGLTWQPKYFFCFFCVYYFILFTSLPPWQPLGQPAFIRWPRWTWLRTPRGRAAVS